MAILSGVLVAGLIIETGDGNVSPSYHAADTYFTADTWAAVPVSAGDTVYGGPTDTLERSLPSSSYAWSQSGFDTFYYRILIEPARLDLGNLVNAQARSVIVWNGFLTSKSMNSVSGVGLEGITVTEPGTPVFTIAPVEELVYTFVVSLEGPPQINALYTWNVSGQSYNLPITGSRVNLWPFRPNWSSPITESLEWKTRVGRSYDGTEQRGSLRHQARRRVNYTFAVLREETQRFDNLTWGWQNRPFAVPFWQYKCKTSAETTAGALSVPVSGIDTAGFAGSNLAVLMTSAENYEVVEVESVGVSSLTLARGTQNTWPANTPIYPASVSNVEGNIAASRLTDSTLTGAVRFLSHPTLVSPFTPDAAAPATYNSHELLLQKPDWAGGLSADRDFQSLQFDAQLGRIEWTPANEVPMWYRAYRWVFKTRAEVKAFREFLQRRKGMFSPCYIPSWHDDFVLLQNIGASDTTMVVKDYGYASMIGLHDARKHLYFRGRDGATYARPITGVTQGDGSVSINFTTPLGVSYSNDTLLGLHSLALWRLASDDVQIEWLTDQVATVNAVFQVVKG